MRNTFRNAVAALMGTSVLLSGCISTPRSGDVLDDWTKDFRIQADDLTTTGRNQFFILEPGFQLVLQGREEKVAITVLDETEVVGGISTRVVEEREEKNGKLCEVSRNYFAISKTTGDVFYFGEDADGAWLAYRENAKPGVVMPGKPIVGMKYYQEVAPGKAMDRAEVVSLTATLTTPAGAFAGCLKTLETTPLSPKEKEYKTYAPEIGLIQDQDLLLVRYGFVGKQPKGKHR